MIRYPRMRGPRRGSLQPRCMTCESQKSSDDRYLWRRAVFL